MYLRSCSFFLKKQLQANATNCKQMLPIANNCKQMQAIANNCKQLQAIEGDTDTVTDNETVTVTATATVIVTDTGTDSGAIYACARVCNAPQKGSAPTLHNLQGKGGASFMGLYVQVLATRFFRFLTGAVSP